jgi:hypothetical protein
VPSNGFARRFHDELLVRTEGGYERTARGERLLAELQDLLPRLETAIRGDHFDPASPNVYQRLQSRSGAGSTSNDRFRIATTDYAGAILLPKLLEDIASVAPRVRLEVVAWNTAGVASVEAGRIEIASAFAASSARSTAIVSPFFLMLHGLDGSRAAADITSVLDPARSSALRGSTSSDCSTSLVAKMAIRFPLRFILLLNSPLHMDPAVKLFCSKVTVIAECP